MLALFIGYIVIGYIGISVALTLLFRLLYRKRLKVGWSPARGAGLFGFYLLWTYVLFLFVYGLARFIGVFSDSMRKELRDQIVPPREAWGNMISECVEEACG